jgi:S-formylglutathione hydrolase FrmB
MRVISTALATMALFLSICLQASATPRILDISIPSKALSDFFGNPVTVDANVFLPESYLHDPDRRYPTIYVIPAFDGPDSIDRGLWQRSMHDLGSEFIVVVLAAMVIYGGEPIHHQFADSANDGPWGTALTSDFIPELDARIRSEGTPESRFLFGHSSGAWSALWLQVNYPDTFNGAWALSPDPVDFHNFLGPDITTNQNFYKDSAGHDYGFCRIRGHDTTTLRKAVVDSISSNREKAYCGGDRTNPWILRQLDTYNVVFSPHGADGNALHMFDAGTGTIDPAIAQYWEKHYDITNILQQRWTELGAKLRGKLHVFVGSADTFHLESSVRLMQTALAALGSDAEIGFDPGADHWQIYDWHGGLVRYAMREMIARLPATTTP